MNEIDLRQMKASFVAQSWRLTARRKKKKKKKKTHPHKRLQLFSTGSEVAALPSLCVQTSQRYAVLPFLTHPHVSQRAPSDGPGDAISCPEERWHCNATPQSLTRLHLAFYDSLLLCPLSQKAWIRRSKKTPREFPCMLPERLFVQER